MNSSLITCYELGNKILFIMDKSRKVKVVYNKPCALAEKWKKVALGRVRDKNPIFIWQRS